MVGQTELLSRLESFGIARLPHTVLLVGPEGCGKHTMAKEVASHYGIGFVDMTDSIDLSTIQSIYSIPSPCMYAIDMSKVTEKEQNTLLKLLEEPSRNAFMFLLATSQSTLLPTVANRCVAFEFLPYTKDELRTFADFSSDTDTILRYCDTPGKVMGANPDAIREAMSLCSNVVDNIGKAKYPNALTITRKFSLKEGDVGIPLSTFFDVMATTLLERAIQGDENALALQPIVSEYRGRYLTHRFANEQLADAMVTEMWRACR